MKQQQKVLITGGAGFVGSHLCSHILGQGFEVICMDNLITGNEKNISRHFNDPKFKFIRHDVSEHIKYEGELDYVLHFASPASPVDYLAYPIQTLKAGAHGTLNTLELARLKGAKYLLASTSEIYGDPLVFPQSEGYFGNVNSIGPRSVYDEAKRFAEAATMAYHRTYGLDTKISRIFNTYGPFMRHSDGRAIPNFITQALSGKPITIYGDGSQTRSFCFVSDMVEGLFKLMSSDVNEPVNLGNPDEKTILNLAEIILEMTKGKSKLKHEPLPIDDPKVRKPDISRARKVLGWEPKVGLTEGLEQTIKWYQSPGQAREIKERSY